jgi:hypothetical protein
MATYLNLYSLLNSGGDNMPRKKEPDLVVAVDFGGSSTKAFYRLPSAESTALVMTPDVVAVPPSALVALEEGKLGAGLPENEAWVGCQDDFYAVGYLAASQFVGNPHLNDLKYRTATVKILALLWVIAAREPQLGKKFVLALSALLPPGEWADRKKFERDLMEACQLFETPCGKLEVELLQFECLPEGAGIYAAYRQGVGERIFHEQIAFFMLGYRNTSCLLSDCGAIKNMALMSPLGMVKMIERVQARTSGLDSGRLLSAIVRAGDEVERDALWRVCRARHLEERSEEVDFLVEVVIDARHEYVAMLSNWMGDVLPDTVDRIVFSGGTADYLRTELTEIYPFTPLEFHGSIEVPQQLDPKGYGSRLVDVFGLLTRLLAQVRSTYESWNRSVQRFDEAS